MTANRSGKAYNDRNVYILGAGFSVEAGLPVIKDFMNRMRDAAAWLDERGNRGDEVAAMDSVLDFRLKAAAAAYRVPVDVENIEELFSLASASGSTELPDQVTMAIAATLDYCSATALGSDLISVTKLGDTKWEKPPHWQFINDLNHPAAVGSVYSCPLYEFYVGLLCGYFNQGGIDRRDTIISLNYDTIVEEALSGLGLPFAYAGDEMIEWRALRPRTDVERRPVTVLKLHGSVNLAARMEKDLNVPPLLAYPSYQDLRREQLLPMLVPPTWQKSLGEYLSEVWREAVSALSTATRVVILGYSVPRTDQHFRYLLAAGLQENISLRKVLVVNNDEHEEFGRRLSGLFRAEHFEQKIIERVTRTVRQFLVTENGGHRIGRALKDGAWRLS